VNGYSPLYLRVAIWHEDTASQSMMRGRYGSSRRRRRLASLGLLAEFHALRGDWRKVHDILAASVQARKWVLGYEPALHRPNRWLNSIYSIRDEQLKAVALALDVRSAAIAAMRDARSALVETCAQN
jgi:hypothetical protein